MKSWWLSVRNQFKRVRTLVICLDNGPNRSGTRTQFLKRLVEFADWSGLTLRKWYGVLLRTLQIVLARVRRM